MTDLRSRACTRAFSLDDIHVRSDGSGRVVEAYAAIFRTRSEIMDQDGHYNEELTGTSFNRTIRNRTDATGFPNFQVLYNHGADIAGRPSGMLTMPIGVPEEVRADDKGVYTATRYLENPLADDVFQAIKAKALRGMSFSGRFLQSKKSYPEGRNRSALPLITRTEVDMREYGPTVFPAYDGAAILGTRAERFVTALLAQPEDHRIEWLRQFEGFDTLASLADPLIPSPSTPDSDSGPADEFREERIQRMRDKMSRFRSRMNGVG
jgi:HK97 family phage prohead protease